MAVTRAFWLKGSVGTGKSCLTTLVIRKLLGGESPDRLAYFYCSKDASKPARTDANDVLRSLIAQLSYPRIEIVRREYEEKRLRRGTLSLEDSVRLLSDILRSAGQCIFIIDALDECRNPYELMKALRAISDSTDNLKLFVSSRLEVRVNIDFPQCLCQLITPEKNGLDVERFIESEIKRRRLEINRRNPEQPEEMNDELAEELTFLLKKHAQGM